MGDDVKERPILFSGPMVRAILAGTKTQTRRTVKPQPSAELLRDYAEIRARNNSGRTDAQMLTDCLPCPYGQPGDYLWVKETFQWFSEDGEVLYRANPKDDAEMRELKFDGCLGAFWRPSIFMPRRLSRITLEITDIRVERLQEISQADAMAEGIAVDECGHAIRDNDPVNWGGARTAYAELWESINGVGSWGANPWVWVVSFKRLEP